MIPRKIHRIWLGGPMPEEYRAFGREWARLHPDWQVIDWGENDLAWLENRREFDAAEGFAVKADIARYEIVLREGGLYVDVDFEPLRNFDDILGDTSLVVGEEFPGHLNNALFGATAGHSLLRQVVSDLPSSVRALPGAGPSQVTGPAFLTRNFHRWRAQSDEPALVLPQERLYPYSWEQKHLRYAKFPEAYAVHHWALSWRPPKTRKVARPSRSQIRARMIDLQLWARSVALRAEALRGRVSRFGKSLGVGSRRPPVVVPAGDGRLLLKTRHGFPILAEGDSLTDLPRVLVHGTDDLAGVEFLRRTLEPGDTYVELGPGSGVRIVAAGWLVSRIGRVLALEADETRRSLLAKTIALNNSLGMPGTPRPTDLSSSELARVLQEAPEVRVLRFSAEEVRLLGTARAALMAGRVRFLSLELDIRRVGQAWNPMADELHRLCREGAGSPFVIESDGRLRSTSLAAALHRDSPHQLVLRFDSRPAI